ncbi:hypothetical protein Tco_0293311 [Tanacetum coccineum]
MTNSTSSKNLLRSWTMRLNVWSRAVFRLSKYVRTQGEVLSSPGSVKIKCKRSSLIFSQFLRLCQKLRRKLWDKALLMGKGCSLEDSKDPSSRIYTLWKANSRKEKISI